MSSSHVSDDQTDTIQRRYQAYKVGIAKTGATSIAGIFGKYRSEHEFMFQTTVGDRFSVVRLAISRRRR